MPHLSDDQRQRFASRREQLFDSMPVNSAAIFAPAPAAGRNGDVEHPYRQASDLYYLTGFVEPESVAILVKEADACRFELVVRPRDKERETWDGRRAGVLGAVDDFGADVAHEISKLDEVLTSAIGGRDALIYELGGHEEMDRRVLTLLRRLRVQKRKGPDGPGRVIDPNPLLHELRLLKRRDEVDTMQRAADVTVAAHNAAMRACRPGLTERQIQAVIEGTFRVRGSERNGYPCIVAGGINATILHYTENDQPLEAGGLLLIDAGAEVDYYTADVTRTFPISGTFSAPQRDIYEIVLGAQEAAIAATVVGATVDGVHAIALRHLVEGLLGLGLLSGDVDTIIEDESYKRLYMHRTSHWLGMDVHDVGSYREADGGSRILTPGMVLTIEPGLYVAEDDEEAPEAYRGIGVRIEDDVLVTDDGPRNLTEACPKSIPAIEALMREPAGFPGL